MTYRWVATFLFAAGALLALGAMILGPFGYEGPSVAAGGGACVLAVLGLTLPLPAGTSRRTYPKKRRRRTGKILPPALDFPPRVL